MGEEEVASEPNLAALAREFFKKFVLHYYWFVSGIVSGGAAFFFEKGGGKMTASLLWVICILAFFVAAFLAWRDQRRETVRALLLARETKDTFQSKIEERDRLLDDRKQQKQRELEECLDSCAAKIRATPNMASSVSALVKEKADKFGAEGVAWLAREIERIGLGNPFRRTTLPENDWHLFIRDAKLAGWDVGHPSFAAFRIAEWMKVKEYPEPIVTDRLPVTSSEQLANERQRRIDWFVDRYKKEYSKDSPTAGMQFKKLADAGILTLQDNSEVQDACNLIKGYGMILPFRRPDDLEKDVLGFFRKAADIGVDIRGPGGMWAWVQWLNGEPFQ